VDGRPWGRRPSAAATVPRAPRTRSSRRSPRAHRKGFRVRRARLHEGGQRMAGCQTIRLRFGVGFSDVGESAGGYA
jgi:hypothetical protein